MKEGSENLFCWSKHKFAEKLFLILIVYVDINSNLVYIFLYNWLMSTELEKHELNRQPRWLHFIRHHNFSFLSVISLKIITFDFTK